MSQSDLARAVQTSETNMGRWERGQHSPRTEFVIRIAEATGRPISFFFTEDEEEEEDSTLGAALESRMLSIAQRRTLV